MDVTTLIIAVIGAVCGILGAVLGVIHTLHQLGKSRVRLRVVPKQAHYVGRAGMSGPLMCIEVINLSDFPVTVSDVGFTSGTVKDARLAVIQPILHDGGSWPRRLDSRESVTVYCSQDLRYEKGLERVSRAYVQTDCGEVKYGKSPALTQYVSGQRAA